MPAGAPTKFKPEFCKLLIEHFSVPLTRIVKKDVITKHGDVIQVEEERPTEFPSLASFAAKIGVHRDTLHEWSQVHHEFSDSLKKAKELQEHWLVNNALQEHVNPTFAIFTAKNVMKWRDKQPDETSEVTVNVNSMSDEQLDQILKKYAGEK